jgi:hypothetical protein
LGPVFSPPSGGLCSEASADCIVHATLSAASWYWRSRRHIASQTPPSTHRWKRRWTVDPGATADAAARSLSYYDLVPTVADVLGFDVREGMDGISVLRR